jgi:hypothetical protein
MLEEKGNNSSTLVTAIFREPFSIAGTISAPWREGFADRNIHAFAAREGQIPELRALLAAIGVPSNVVDLYGDCLDEGGPTPHSSPKPRRAQEKDRRRAGRALWGSLRSLQRQ